jgi:hypothetical protein
MFDMRRRRDFSKELDQQQTPFSIKIGACGAP